MAKHAPMPKYMQGREFLEMLCAVMGVNPDHVQAVDIHANWRDMTEIVFHYSGRALPDDFGTKLLPPKEDNLND